jgi:hypothetical protein
MGVPLTGIVVQITTVHGAVDCGHDTWHLDPRRLVSPTTLPLPLSAVSRRRRHRRHRGLLSIVLGLLSTVLWRLSLMLTLTLWWTVIATRSSPSSMRAERGNVRSRRLLVIPPHLSTAPLKKGTFPKKGVASSSTMRSKFPTPLRVSYFRFASIINQVLVGVQNSPQHSFFLHSVYTYTRYRSYRIPLPSLREKTKQSHPSFSYRCEAVHRLNLISLASRQRQHRSWPSRYSKMRCEPVFQ